MNRFSSSRYGAANRVAATEIRFVRAAHARSDITKTIAVAINQLGNAWLYPVLAWILFGMEGKKAVPAFIAAVLSVGLAHSVYPVLKKWSARPRPFRIDPALKTPADPLDEFSFPSGHIMTLSATLIPLAIAAPDLLVGSIVLWFAMAWAGISLAHHYPSDVIAGGALGAIISVPISIYIL